MQRMKPPARDTQVVQRLGSMQRLQAAPNALDEIRTDAAWIVVEKEDAKRFTVKAHDHDRDCKTSIDICQLSLDIHRCP